MKTLARDRRLEGGSDERASDINDPRVETSHRAKPLVRVALRVGQSISSNREIVGPESSRPCGCWVEGHDSSSWWRSFGLRETGCGFSTLHFDGIEMEICDGAVTRRRLQRQQVSRLGFQNMGRRRDGDEKDDGLV
jgi:hypothetical protein